MTNRREKAPGRRVVCSGCGTEFGCDLSEACWCAEETARLPMPVEGGDCLCRECLRKAAAASHAEASRS
ncbi:MAG TPA: hypothetical protein VHC94_13810 [Nitrobacter sp.]|nr:hypothetical protein [Nitrobacter sp.]